MKKEDGCIFLFRHYTMRGSIYEELNPYGLRVLVVEANTVHTRRASVLTPFDGFIISGKYVQIVSEF